MTLYQNNTLRKLIIALLLLALLCPPFRAQTGRPSRMPVFVSRGVEIGPGKYLSYGFQVPSRLEHGRLAGSIYAQGGTGNDVQVLIYRGQQVIYNSGPRRSIVLSVPITETGDYALVLSNTMSLLSTKWVWGNVALVYDGVESAEQEQARRAEETQRNHERVQLANQVLTKLWLALRRAEAAWGTSQVPVRPRLIISGNSEVNAFAAVNANTITLNQGAIELAESHGEQEQDLLAGVLGHELAHLVDRHRHGGQSGSLWDEFNGRLRLDRTEEAEADALGVRLACAAGFAPRGASLFMRGMLQHYGNQGGLLGDHPQTRERVATLEREAAACKH